MSINRDYTESVAIRRKKFAIAASLATAIAIPAEGLRQWAYNDIAEPTLLTVCYGSTTNVERGKKYSLEECKQRLDTDMLQALETVDRCVPGLPSKKLAAFGDAVYNLGPTLVCNKEKSTAARLLAAGRWDDACRQLPRWNKARIAGIAVELPGLTKRRNAEATLCLEPENG